MKKTLALLIVLLVIGAVNAGTDVSTDIETSTHWTKAGHPYHLKDLIYVRPGATLTIDPGVVVASYAPDQGSLAVCAGARIYVNGTQDEPVIMTSAQDVDTWTGSVVTKAGSIVIDINTLGDPKTGTWRPSCLEWGNLTIMGNAYISASHYDDKVVRYDYDPDGDGVGDPNSLITNTAYPSALNKKRMEGLEADYAGDPRVLYGGGDDNDNSGSISHLSIRYGGKVIVDTDELNGLSLGAIGRGTDISYVEIMNNVDDGIEIWGGTVQLDHVSIWNVGDDSFDVDEGWRGSAQYGLIVQGYSAIDKQGSGVGDNVFEIDGAEDANAQPRTTARISNFTAVGQPGDTNAGGDGGTTWRDNARVQYDSCIWMDLDDHLVKFDCQDGDGADGYDGDANDNTKLRTVALDGTMSWVDHWETSYNEWIASANALTNINDANLLSSLYAQYITTDLDAPLCQITNSVTYEVKKTSEANDLGVWDAGKNNVKNAASMPIQGLTRDSEVIIAASGSKWSMLPVTSINPCAANDALNDDGTYAGGFSGCYNWLAGWTAADAYGMTDTSMNAIQGDNNCDGGVDLLDMGIVANDWLYGK